jgi:hypothetical protein
MDVTQLNEGAATQPDAGIDIESQIHDGVVAFMQSQDPAIAVEVITMIASMMGIAPQVDTFAQQAPAPMASPVGAPVPSQTPMGGNGMRMYRAGGKVLKNNGEEKPDPKKKKGTTTQLVEPSATKRTLFRSQDYNKGKIHNRDTTPELGKSMREGVDKTLKRSRIQALGRAGKNISEAGGKRIGNKAVYDAGKGTTGLAGEFIDLEFDTPGYKHTLPPLEFSSHYENTKRKKDLTPASEIRQKYGKGPKRRLERVSYLQGKGYGRNKRSESGH